MKIAQVSPLYESVPPNAYGGTERVVSHLTEELVTQGHDVSLFASGDSKTQARLVPIVDMALRSRVDCEDPFTHHILQLEQVFEAAEDFDIIHFHTDYFHFPLSRRCATPTLTTLHGRLDLPDLKAIYSEFREMPLVSISEAQRWPLACCRPKWLRTIYHGLPKNQYVPNFRPGSYLAFLGRISPEKRVDRAVEIARLTGVPLKVAAKVDKVDREYFHQKIEHLFADPLVEYVGEIGDEDKQGFLGEAAALLFPIDWPEPFGLVMIESMACGTPVVAFRNGSVPEIVMPGQSGFIVETVEDAAECVRGIHGIDRRGVREYFEESFSVEKMTGSYIDVYQELIEAGGQGRDLYFKGSRAQ